MDLQANTAMGSGSILILGSHGSVGSAIASTLGARAVRAARKPCSTETLPFDALVDDGSRLLEQMKTPPKAVVIAFGISGVHTCAKDPAASRFINVDRVISAAKAAVKFDAVPVLFSTDSVFDGSEKLWSEDDEPNPINEYGRQKLAAEQAVRQLGIPYLVLRLSRVIADHNQHRDLLYMWCNNIAHGEEILVPVDQNFTPISAADLARVAVRIIDADIRGLIQVAGPRRTSAPELFQMLMDCGRRIADNLSVKAQRCRVADLPGLDHRPPNTMLSIRRLEQLINPRFESLQDTVMSVATAAFSARLRQPVQLSHSTTHE